MMVRDMIVGLCRRKFPSAHVLEAPNGAAGVAHCRQSPPDIVLLDLDLPDGDGMDRVEAIRALAPEAKIIIVTSHSDEFSIYRSLQLNVSAFVDKCAQPMTIVRQAISAVAAGRTYYSPVVSRVLERLRADPVAFTKLLSRRELEILRFLGEGLENDVIARHFGVSPLTIHTYRRNIMCKLGVHSASELIRYSVEKGFSRLRSTTRASA